MTGSAVHVDPEFFHFFNHASEHDARAPLNYATPAHNANVFRTKFLHEFSVYVVCDVAFNAYRTAVGYIAAVSTLKYS